MPERRNGALCNVQRDMVCEQAAAASVPRRMHGVQGSTGEARFACAWCMDQQLLVAVAPTQHAVVHVRCNEVPCVLLRSHTSRQQSTSRRGEPALDAPAEPFVRLWRLAIIC